MRAQAREQRKARRSGSILSKKGWIITIVASAVVFGAIGGPSGFLFGGVLAGTVGFMGWTSRHIRQPIRYAVTGKVKKVMLNNRDIASGPEVDGPSLGVEPPAGDAQGPRTYPLADKTAQTYLTWLNEAYRATTPAGVEHVVKMAQYQPADPSRGKQATALLAVIKELSGLPSADAVRAHIDQRLAPLDAAARNLAPPRPRPQPARPGRQADRGDGLTRFGGPGQQEFNVGPASGGLNSGAGGSLDIN